MSWQARHEAIVHMARHTQQAAVMVDDEALAVHGMPAAQQHEEKAMCHQVSQASEDTAAPQVKLRIALVHLCSS